MSLLKQPLWPRFLPTSMVLAFARVGPFGRARYAPGTWGSVAEFRLGRRDPGEVVLDEFVAMPLCFFGWQRLTIGDLPWPPWAIFLGGFALFRLYDVSKPLGINKLQDLPAGWGVAIDDTAAALAACATLHLIHSAWLNTHVWLQMLSR